MHAHRQADDELGQAGVVGNVHALPLGCMVPAGWRRAVYAGLIPWGGAGCGRKPASNQADTESHRGSTEFHRGRFYWRFALLTGAPVKAPCAQRHLLPL
jgi:hypothetical protein